MRAVAETAVRLRAGVTSFHMALQMAALTMLAGVTIWAFSTLLLVWFCVYQYLPARAALLQALDVLVALQGGHSAPLLNRSLQWSALPDFQRLPLERQRFTTTRTRSGSGTEPDGAWFQRCWDWPWRPTCLLPPRAAVRANTFECKRCVVEMVLR